MQMERATGEESGLNSANLSGSGVPSQGTALQRVRNLIPASVHRCWSDLERVVQTQRARQNIKAGGHHRQPPHMIYFHFGGRPSGGARRAEATAAAAGDRWSERMNRDPDSHAPRSAGRKGSD